MSTAAGGLRDLHEKHIALEKVREEMARGPRQVRNAEKRVAKREEEIKELQERLKQLKVSADQKSLQMKTHETNIADLKAKLNAAKTNKEFDAFKSQIDADEMAMSVLEDETLEVYEKIDQFEADIKEAEQQRDAAKSEVQQVKARIEQETQPLRARADELEQALTALERTLPESIAVTYRRLVSAHGADALSPVQNQTCMQCSVRIRTNTQVELNMGKYVFCGSCGRLLYAADEE